VEKGNDQSNPGYSVKIDEIEQKNALGFGFIVRYPKGKEQITGYQFEP
jgi:LAS superfamily LD-carboxypeptidase LdcB